jgi:hypothetical protein
MKRYAEGSGYVVIASARGAQAGGRIGYKLWTATAYKNVQAFQNTGDLDALKTVVPVLALNLDTDQTFGQETA